MGIYSTRGRKAVLAFFLITAIWNGLTAEYMLATFAGGVVGAVIWSAALIFIWSKLTGGSGEDVNSVTETPQ